MLFALCVDCLYCLLFFKTVSAELKPGLYEKFQNKRFSNVIKSISTTSAIACCVMCEKTDSCLLVSYHKESRTCELGSFRPGDDALIQTVVGWSLYINTEDDCANSPCLNSGTCLDNIGHYTCSCSAGWTGVNCETGLCPPGWDQIGRSCYFIDTSLQSWTSAQATCGVSGGHLLHVNTATENKDVCNLYNRKHPGIGKNVWIGGQDVYQNETFYWTDGTLVSDGFEFWISDQPDNWDGAEFCIFLQSYQGFEWNDSGCGDAFWSICEKDLA